MADAQGRVTVLEVYRCDFPGCAKLFQSRGALHTHQVRLFISLNGTQTDTHKRYLSTMIQGWHKRRPKEGQTFMVQQAHKRSGQGNLVETPRKRTRRDGAQAQITHVLRFSSYPQ